jgi:TonB family protein
LERLVKAHTYAPAYALVAAGEKDESKAVAIAYRKLRQLLDQSLLADEEASAADRLLAQPLVESGSSESMPDGEILETQKLTGQPKTLQRTLPEYPLELRKAGVTGEALVEFIVTRDGYVVNAFAVRATHPLFATAAVEAVKHWRFAPGVVNGRRVHTRMQQRVSFSLADETPAKPKP